MCVSVCVCVCLSVCLSLCMYVCVCTVLYMCVYAIECVWVCDVALLHIIILDMFTSSQHLFVAKCLCVYSLIIIFVNCSIYLSIHLPIY